MATLNYTVREINRNYKIKVYGRDAQGEKINTLLGVSGYLKLIDDDGLANRLLARAFACMEDVCHCRLRRGIKVSFYAV